MNLNLRKETKNLIKNNRKTIKQFFLGKKNDFNKTFKCLKISAISSMMVTNVLHQSNI
jgi:hypothetical protein